MKIKRKKKFGQNRFWATAQLYCEEKKNFVLQYSFCIAEKKACRAEIVLQEGQVYCNRGSLAADETVLQYSLVGSRFVLQYKLYCELGEGLGRDTAWAGAGRARSVQASVCRRAGVRCRQLGARARGCAEQAAAGSLAASGVRGREGAGAGRGRQALGVLGARGLGAQAGFELCTRCTRPVFGPVRLGNFLSQIFWTLFVNSVHEHCSSQNFSEIKNLLNSNKMK